MLVSTCVAALTSCKPPSWMFVSLTERQKNPGALKYNRLVFCSSLVSLCTSENSQSEQKCQHLYLITATAAPSLSIKALTPGRTLYFVLKVCRRCGNATAHMHLFITPRCIYISQEISVSLFERWFPCGVSQGDKQSRKGGVWADITAWGLFYVSS